MASVLWERIPDIAGTLSKGEQAAGETGYKNDLLDHGLDLKRWVIDLQSMQQTAKGDHRRPCHILSTSSSPYNQFPGLGRENLVRNSRCETILKGLTSDPRK